MPVLQVVVGLLVLSLEMRMEEMILGEFNSLLGRRMKVGLVELYPFVVEMQVGVLEILELLDWRQVMPRVDLAVQ